MVPEMNGALMALVGLVVASFSGCGPLEKKTWWGSNPVDSIHYTTSLNMLSLQMMVRYLGFLNSTGNSQIPSNEFLRLYALKSVLLLRFNPIDLLKPTA